MKKNKYVSISVNKDFYDQLNIYCQERGLMKSRFVEITCLKVLNKNKKNETKNI